MNIFYKIAVALLLAYIATVVFHLGQWAGWCLMLCLVSVALGFRSHAFLRGFSYTMIILAGVGMALYYPQYFVKVGDFSLSGLIVPLLQVIMFGMGTELSLKDFAAVLRMPKGVIIGVVCHYTIMPLVGFTVTHHHRRKKRSQQRGHGRH